MDKMSLRKLLSYVSLVSAVMMLTACSNQPTGLQYSLPLQQAWFEGETVFYVTTDVSDQAMAEKMGANYAPRLRDAIPNYPKPPRQKTVIERVYGFPNGEQRNVFPSAPIPTGFQSTDTAYSPIWLMYAVKWVDPKNAYELTSEDAVLDADAKGLVNIERTNIVVNCPVVPAP